MLGVGQYEGTRYQSMVVVACKGEELSGSRVRFLLHKTRQSADLVSLD